MRKTAFLLFLMLSALLASIPARAGDIPGSSDHYMITRYAGSTIIGHEVKSYDEYRLILGPQGRDANGEVVVTKSEMIEGKVTRIMYKSPKDRSTLEVYRNYEKALKAAGFEELFNCKESSCGDLFHHVCPESVVEYALYGGDKRFLAARLRRKEGDVYVSLYVIEHTLMNAHMGHVMVQLDIIEQEPMDEGMVAVEAEAMAKGIEAEGHIALYGIYFDTDSDVIRPESGKTLSEIKKLLDGNPGLSVFIVGHTDGTGHFDHNMGLSKRRAGAVVRRLASDYGIAAERLNAEGVGPLSPVVSNGSEEGRARNRRVELVKK